MEGVVVGPRQPMTWVEGTMVAKGCKYTVEMVVSSYVVVVFSLVQSW
jgi:hypothetical protein